MNCCTLINDYFKSYFLKKPLSMLCAIYIFNVFAVGYIIYAVGKYLPSKSPRTFMSAKPWLIDFFTIIILERAHGTCMLYGDVLWMMGVTITNLGYGDFTPSNYISRIIISILSLLGKLLNSVCSVDSNVVPF